MKILVLNWQDLSNPMAGGAEVHLEELINESSRFSFNVRKGKTISTD